MEQYVVDYNNGIHQTSAKEFASVIEAQLWQAEVLLHSLSVGVLMPLSVWQVSTNGDAFNAKLAKNAKVEELGREAESRMDVYPVMIAVLAAAHEIADPSGQSSDDQEILEVYQDELSEIAELSTLADVLAYDVVNDPDWP